jgi:hypothetical protein
MEPEDSLPYLQDLPVVAGIGQTNPVNILTPHFFNIIFYRRQGLLSHNFFMV